MMYEKQIKDRLLELQVIAQREWDYDPAIPTLDFSLKGEVGGQAYILENRLRINRQALHKYTDHYIKQTIGHEYAHLVTHDYWDGNRVRSHGHEWASVMRSFDLKPDRCHTYELDKARNIRRGFIYHCVKCGKEFNFTSIRHNRAMKGTQNYRHSTDGGKLEYKGKS